MDSKFNIAAARETAATLFEDRGFYPAKRQVQAALNATAKDEMESFFWSRVWDELHKLWDEANNGVKK